ncbi:MAG: type II toxin-antitoxin system prevent-host-death family antitoxin [Candidatus Acidiferrales bacterium]|jgi:prevent-host-death family protein
MRTVGLFEAKQKLSELVERAGKGERIGITRRGKLTALIIPPQPERSLKESFDEIEKVRKKVRLPKGVTIKSMIEEGRV